MSPSRQNLFPQWNSLPLLSGREVQVFGIRVQADSDLPQRAEKLLSSLEQERAERILATTAHDEFVVGRAALRFLTGFAIGIDPAAVKLEIGIAGKPSVSGVESNVTHSRGLIYIAISRETPVGIDVEWVDPSLEAMEIAEANFREEEVFALGSQSMALDRAKLFYELWTRKEAVAKATGGGLRIPLHQIVVPRTDSGAAWIEPEIPDERDTLTEHATFHVSNLPAPQGFVLALAIQGNTAPHISHWGPSEHNELRVL